MSETPQQYTERILANVTGDPLEILAASAPFLHRLVDGAARDVLHRSPGAGRWCIAEILAHLADAEVVFAFRLRKVAAEPGCAIAAYDQNLWAEKMDYRARDPHHSLRTFATLRELNLQLLNALRPEQWENYGIHSERGKETMRHMVRMYAGHDLNHRHQVASLYDWLANKIA